MRIDESCLGLDDHHQGDSVMGSSHEDQLQISCQLLVVLILIGFNYP